MKEDKKYFRLVGNGRGSNLYCRMPKNTWKKPIKPWLILPMH